MHDSVLNTDGRRPGSYLNVLHDPESCCRLCKVQVTILAAETPAPLFTCFRRVSGVVIVATSGTPTILRLLRVEFFKTKRCLSVPMDDHDLVLLMGNFLHACLVVLVETIALRVSGRLPLSTNILSLSIAVVRLARRRSFITTYIF